VLSVTGTADEPAKAGIPVADIAAGMYAYSSILNALLLRARTGQGSDIDVSMLEALTEWMGFPLYYAIDGQSPPPRSGASHATIYPYGPFSAGDGKVVMLAIQNEREWALFCSDVLRRSDLMEDARFKGSAARSTHRRELKAIIEEIFRGLGASDVVGRLDAARIANGRMNTLDELWSHPQLAAREHWAEVDSPIGKLPNLLPPAKSSGYTPRLDAVPALGAHTDAILRELGYDAAAIRSLRAQGAI
jgi:crotonobetainyl-CoA:carnitine CoA-transferase CaiB-like acyl-CoA transferase